MKRGFEFLPPSLPAVFKPLRAGMVSTVMKYRPIWGLDIVGPRAAVADFKRHCDVRLKSGTGLYGLTKKCPSGPVRFPLHKMAPNNMAPIAEWVAVNLRGTDCNVILRGNPPRKRKVQGLVRVRKRDGSVFF